MNVSEMSLNSLWVVLSDVAEVLSKHTQEDSEVSMYWYLLYVDIQKEIDKRLMNGGNNNE